MGIRSSLVAAFVVLATAAPSLRAQPGRVARHAYRALEDLRSATAAALTSAGPGVWELEAVREPVASLLIGERVEPYRSVGKLWSAFHDGPADDDAAIRASVVLLALPEVVDANHFEGVYLTVHAPRPLEFPGRIDLYFDRIDGDEIVEVAKLEDQSEDDLRGYKTSILIPLDVLGEAPAHEFSVRVRLDGRPHRESDWSCRRRVWRQDDFAARARALPALLDEFSSRLQAWDEMVGAGEGPVRDRYFRAQLQGACDAVDRVWNAEPGGPLRDPIEDLRRCERLAAAQSAGEDPAQFAFASGQGLQTLSVPLSPKAGATGRLELGQVSFESGGPKARAVVVIFPGVPSFDGRLWRPQTVRSTAPDNWLSRLRRQGFGPSGGDPFHLCVLESVGGVRDPYEFLGEVIGLIETLGLPIVLVGEREGGVLSARFASEQRETLAGLVCVCGGTLSTAQLERFVGTEGRSGVRRVALFVPATGNPTEHLYPRLAELSPAARTTDPQGVPWVFALERSLSRVRDLVEEVAPARSTVR